MPGIVPVGFGVVVKFPVGYGALDVSEVPLGLETDGVLVPGTPDEVEDGEDKEVGCNDAPEEPVPVGK